jgi:hypothetical protein
VFLPGERARFELADSRRVSGTLLAQSEGAIVLRSLIGRTLRGTAYDTLRLVPDSVVRAWVAEGREFARGAAYGAIAGTVLGLAFALSPDEGLDDCDRECWTRAIPLFTLSGGVVGALVGLLFPHWKEVRGVR